VPVGGSTDVVAPADLRDRMGKTRGVFSGYLRALRGRGSVDGQTWDDLEEALLRADVGVATTTALLEDLRQRVRSGELRGPDAVVAALRAALRASLEVAGGVDLRFEEGVTNVWLFVGVNGVGKTTTIGKIARRQVAQGRTLLLAAGDTFRAAAIEQLRIWARRTFSAIVERDQGADAAGLAFDALTRARELNVDVVLMDTAGRLQNRTELMSELEKIIRVMRKVDADAPHAVLLVLDATVGQNALSQVEIFGRIAGVTGLVMTKLDGTARGGILVAIADKFALPVHFIGVGEGVDDLEPFAARDFADAIAGIEREAA